MPMAIHTHMHSDDLPTTLVEHAWLLTVSLTDQLLLLPARFCHPRVCMFIYVHTFVYVCTLQDYCRGVCICCSMGCWVASCLMHYAQLVVLHSSMLCRWFGFGVIVWLGWHMHHNVPCNLDRELCMHFMTQFPSMSKSKMNKSAVLWACIANA